MPQIAFVVMIRDSEGHSWEDLCVGEDLLLVVKVLHELFLIIAVTGIRQAEAFARNEHGTFRGIDGIGRVESKALVPRGDPE